MCIRKGQKVMAQTKSRLTKKLSFLNLSSMDEMVQIIWDFEIPSLFSTDISHSTPVPRSTHFRMGTFAVVTGRTPETWPISKEMICTN